MHWKFKKKSRWTSKCFPFFFLPGLEENTLQMIITKKCIRNDFYYKMVFIKIR